MSLMMMMVVVIGDYGRHPVFLHIEVPNVQLIVGRVGLVFDDPGARDLGARLLVLVVIVVIVVVNELLSGGPSPLDSRHRWRWDSRSRVKHQTTNCSVFFQENFSTHREIWIISFHLGLAPHLFESPLVVFIIIIFWLLSSLHRVEHCQDMADTIVFTVTLVPSKEHHMRSVELSNKQSQNKTPSTWDEAYVRRVRAKLYKPRKAAEVVGTREKETWSTDTHSDYVNESVIFSLGWYFCPFPACPSTISSSSTSPPASSFIYKKPGYVHVNQRERRRSVCLLFTWVFYLQSYHDCGIA